MSEVLTNWLREQREKDAAEEAVAPTRLACPSCSGFFEPRYGRHMAAKQGKPYYMLLHVPLGYRCPRHAREVIWGGETPQQAVEVGAEYLCATP